MYKAVSITSMLHSSSVENLHIGVVVVVTFLWGCSNPTSTQEKLEKTGTPAGLNIVEQSNPEATKYPEAYDIATEAIGILRDRRRGSNVRPTSPAITPIIDEPLSGAVDLTRNQIIQRLGQCPDVRKQMSGSCTTFAIMGAAMMVLPKEVAATLPYNDNDIEQIFKKMVRNKYDFHHEAFEAINTHLPHEHQLLITPIQSFNEAIACLRNGGAPYFGVYASDNWDVWQNNKNRRITELPVLKCSTHKNLQIQNHQIFAVGSTEDGNLIIQNSWGNEWGYNGRAILSGSTCRITDGFCVQPQNK